MGYDSFKSKFCEYYRLYDNSESLIPKLKDVLDLAVKCELPKRDNHYIFQVRDFTNSQNINININNDLIKCYYDKNSESLMTACIGPCWSSGWRKIFLNDFIEDIISGFFHFAEQYVYRSRQINLIGAIALTYSIACDFKGGFYSSTFYNPLDKWDDFLNEISQNITNRTKLLNHYLSIINALDPFVNKVIYYYCRMLSLKRLMFDEEALTNADNMVDTIYQAIKINLKLPTMRRLEMGSIVSKELCLSNTTIQNLDNLYQLRCGFCAHPAQSKWWDFSEIYEENIDIIYDEVKTILIKFCMYERSHCHIEPNPVKWSEWFYKYCDVLFDAVWFNKLPILDK